MPVLPSRTLLLKSLTEELHDSTLHPRHASGDLGYPRAASLSLLDSSRRKSVRARNSAEPSVRRVMFEAPELRAGAGYLRRTDVLQRSPARSPAS